MELQQTTDNITDADAIAADVIAAATENAISVTAENTDTESAPQTDTAVEIKAEELTKEERAAVYNYAVNDEEVRRAVIADYLEKLKGRTAAPAVMQGDIGLSPEPAARQPRDMREAAALAEAVMKKGR